MKKIHFTIILILTTQIAYSQYWIVGDSTNYSVNILDTPFGPDSKVVFDIDCDGTEDFNINSSGPIGSSWPWKRLSFYMQEGVEVFNSNTGTVTTFETGDTMPFYPDTLWTRYLDFIYGTGETGSYGQYEINEKYIAFRKSSDTDTFFCFIKFSNLGIDFTIHQIISNCEINPLEIITNTIGPGSESFGIYPNPTTDKITLSGEATEYVIYTANGAMVDKGKTSLKTIDLTRLQKGIYFIRLIGRSQQKMFKIIKI